MDGLYRISGSDMPLEINGKTYYLSPDVGTLQTLGMVEAYAVSKRRTALAASADSLHLFSEDAQKLIVKVALELDSQIARGATPDEVDAVLETREGIALCLWVGLKKNHPEIDSHEKAIALLANLTDTQLRLIKRGIDAAAGFEHLGNSTGLGEATTETTTQESDANASPGLASTAT